MTGVSTNGLARPPVTVLAVTVSTSSSTTRSRMPDDGVCVCWKVMITANMTSTIDVTHEVRGGAAQHPEGDSGEDRDPAGGDREPDQPVLDLGRDRVARGQRGRQATEPFLRSASGHGELPPAIAPGRSRRAFTRFSAPGSVS